MVDASDAIKISEEVQRRYGMAMTTRVVRRDELMPTREHAATSWASLEDVPPSYFDTFNLFLVEPYTNWPSEAQINQGPGGAPGLSKRYTFFLVAREFAHKMFCPGGLFMKMQERAVLKEVQMGWEAYQPYFDAMICDVINMNSEFVARKFEDFPNLIELAVLEKNGLKLKQLFSNGADIITWEEVTCRILFATAEKRMLDKNPDQSPEDGGAGALWPGLKKTPEGRQQMILCQGYYDVVMDAVEAIVENDPKSFLIAYREMANRMKKILGEAAGHIVPPLPLSIAHDSTDIDGIGVFGYIEEAKEFMEKHAEALAKDVGVI